MDLLEEYINNIRHETLTPKREKELLGKIANGDLKARQEMITNNLRLVVSFLNNIRYKEDDVIDIIQEGNIGLIKAVDKFDLKYNVRFSTYAMYWIKQSIYKYLNNNRLVHIPENVLAMKRKIKKAEDELLVSLRREPEDDDIAIATGYTVDQVKDNKLHMKTALSLNFLMRTGESIDMLADEDTNFMDDEDLEELRGAMEKVNERDKDVLKRRFGIGMNCQTLTKVGADLGLSRERVRQIENNTIDELRNILKKV